MNGCEMRTIERKGWGEEMLLPRVNGEWTEDLSRKVTRVVDIIGDIGRIHPKFGRSGQTSDERRAFSGRERTKLGQYNHHHRYHVQTRWQAQAFEGKNNIY